MMAVFDFITAPTKEQFEEAVAINEQYFTIDTVSIPQLREWIAHNPYMDTYAMLDGRVHGFFNVFPIGDKCGELFGRQEMKEEDLTVEHILTDEYRHLARYAYLAAIAVSDRESYVSKQCVTAMLSVIASHLLYGYDEGRLKCVFANPTTFAGNHLVRKLGLHPLYKGRKPLKAGNDIYVLEMDNPETRAGLRALERRYARFVGTNPWSEASQKK